MPTGCEDRGQDQRAEDQRKQEHHQSEGDAARREAAGLAPAARARHDDARRPAQGNPGGDGLARLPPPCLRHRWRAIWRSAQCRRRRQRKSPDPERPAEIQRRSLRHNWEHTIAFEKSEPAVEGQSYPVCIAGKRNCPPEDCGGVWGYEELLAILADPAHPEHAEQTDWTGEEFNPDEFDLERANTVLAARFRKK